MSTKILAALLFISAIAVVGCSDNNPSGIDAITNSTDNSFEEVAKYDQLHGLASCYGPQGGHNQEPVTFTVRLENISTGATLMLSNGETAPAPHSPGVWAVTRLFNPLFRVNHYDLGIGMEQQAEDGDPSVLGPNVAANPRVKSSGIFLIPEGDDSPGPALPGKAYVFEVTAYPGDRLSFSSMFGQSNDLFYAPGRFGIPLFNWKREPLSGDMTRFVYLWDAGTEVNQEPGLGADQAPRQSGPNTGETEHKRVRRVHDQFTYPHTNEVIKVTITPNIPS